MKRLSIINVLYVMLIFSTQAFGQSSSGTLPINGIEMYYEIHGEGEPLLLLHGGLGSSDMFSPLIPELAESHQLILVDLHGHGRTNLGDRKIDLVDMGSDVAAILKELEFKKVDVVGYSMGAGASMQFAIQYPEMVNKLVLISGAFSRDGFYPEILEQQAMVGAEMAEMMKNTPMYQSYMKVAPNPEDFPKLLDQMGAFMKQPYNWAEEVKSLKMPVMLVYGDSDMFRPEHMVEFYQLLGGGLRDAGWMREHMSQNRLAILPNATHYDIFMSPKLTSTILPFLDNQKDVKSWSEQVNNNTEN